MELRDHHSSPAEAPSISTTSERFATARRTDIAVVSASDIEDRIEQFVEGLACLFERQHRTWCLIAIDDSDDGTTEALERLSTRGLPVHTFHRSPVERVGAFSGALVEGVGLADSEVVLVVDPALEVPPDKLGALLAPVLDGSADLAVGVANRSDRGLHSRWHRMVLGVARGLAKACSREARKVHDPNSGLIAFRRHVVDGVVLKPERFRVLIGVLVRGHYSRCVDVRYSGRRLLGTGRVRTTSVLLSVSHIVRLWLEIRVEPMRHAADRRTSTVWSPFIDRPSLTNSSVPLGVLIVASEVPPVVSGVSRSVAELGAQLTTLGHTVEPASSRDTWRGSIGEFRATTLGWKLATSHRLNRYDVVFLHGPVPTMSEVLLVGLAIRRWRGGPRVVYTQQFDVEIANLGILSMLYNIVNYRLANLADAIVTTTPSYGATMAAGIRTPVEVIPWGVHLPDRPSAVRSGGMPLNALFVGQLRPYKGVDRLILAAADSTFAELTVVGAGPLEQHCADLVRRLAATNILLLRRVDDATLPEMFANHDVIALRDALKHLAAHPEEVQRLSVAAAQRSREFASSEVGLRYQPVLYQALGRP